MNAASIEKLKLIDTHFIQSDCKVPALTDPSGIIEVINSDRLDYTFDPNLSANSVYYRTVGIRENPKFTSTGAIDTGTLTNYSWPADTILTGWNISSSNTDTYKAFDKSTSTTSIWSSAANTFPVPSGTQPPHITIQYPSPVLINKIAIKISANIAQAPKSFKLYGCKKINAEGELRWFFIKSFSNLPAWTQREEKTFADFRVLSLYDGFKIVFTEIQEATDNIVTVEEINIFTQYDNAWSADMPTAPAKITGINFSARLKTINSSSLQILNFLRICYNLLDDPSKFVAYKAQTPTLKVEKYNMASAGVYATADLTEINSIIDAIFMPADPLSKLHPDKTNFFALKRLLKAYEYIIHVKIAMAYEPGASTPITDLILNSLNDENNLLIDTEYAEYGYARMQKKLEEATSKYNKRLDTIDKLDVQLEDLKEDVVKEKTNKTTNSNILNKNTVVYYVFLLLFIILVCVLLYALQKEADETSKLYVGGVIVTGIVAMIIVYFLNMTYLKEGFATQEMSASNLEMFIEKYLTDTLNIALLNNNESAYSNIMYVVDKEIDRYDGINKQLKLEAAGTNDIQVDDYRNARVLQYRVYLLLQLIIILSIAMFIYLYTGENILLFGIVLLMLLFVVYMYIMNTHGMVHTDATKIYWGQPSILNNV